MIDGETSMHDLGLDSLFIIQTFEQVRDVFNVDLDDMVLASAPRLDDLAAAIAAAQGTSRRERIQVWATFSPEPLAEALARGFAILSRPADVRSSRFDQPPAPLWKGELSTLIAAVRLSDWGRQQDPSERALALGGWTADFSRTIVALCPGSETRAMREEFAAALGARAGVDIIDAEFLAQGMLDKRADAAGKVPYTEAGFDAIADRIITRLK